MPVKTDYKDLIKIIICSIENRNCMLHECDTCPPVSVLTEYINDIFVNNNYVDDIITFKQWRITDRAEYTIYNDI